MEYITEPAKKVPLFGAFDLCVAGGSTTGVFAAVRAARMGLKVVIVEMQNAFGGTATQSFVSDWHSINDIDNNEIIIKGLTLEVLEKLKKRSGYVTKTKLDFYQVHQFNSEELKFELDLLVKNENITPLLHTRICDVQTQGRRIRGVYIENKSGRQFIKADYFIDATGDGDLAWKAGVPYRMKEERQPGTFCARLEGMTLSSAEYFKLLDEHGPEAGIRDKDHGWFQAMVGTRDITLHYDRHVFDLDSTDAVSLTRGEMAGRAHVWGAHGLVAKYYPGKEGTVIATAAHVGIRESRHFDCSYSIRQEDLLSGKVFDDAIGLGTYPLDIHDSQTGGTELKFLNGMSILRRAGEEPVIKNTKAPSYPSFYTIPYRSLLPKETDNLLIAGRSIDADDWSFGGLRVMVNCNQTGEAAGVACALAARKGLFLEEVDAADLREVLGISLKTQ